MPEWAEIKEKARHAEYRRGEVPDGVLRLSIAADVQKQSIPYVIRGWGPRATSWLIDWGYLRGDTAETEVWDQLAELISTPIDGLPIHLTFVDSGFRPGKADTLPLNRVYEFCRRFPKRVRPTKGSSAPMRVPLLLSKIEVNRSGKGGEVRSRSGAARYRSLEMLGARALALAAGNSGLVASARRHR
ncbi:phage terminase large subunit GpA-like protein [Bradyrhizobium diazoefficiens]